MIRAASLIDAQHSKRIEHRQRTKSWQPLCRLGWVSWAPPALKFLLRELIFTSPVRRTESYSDTPGMSVSVSVKMLKFLVQVIFSFLMFLSTPLFAEKCHEHRGSWMSRHCFLYFFSSPVRRTESYSDTPGVSVSVSVKMLKFLVQVIFSFLMFLSTTLFFIRPIYIYIGAYNVIPVVRPFLSAF